MGVNLILANKNKNGFYFKSFFVHLQISIMTYSATHIIASFLTVPTFIGSTGITTTTR